MTNNNSKRLLANVEGYLTTDAMSTIDNLVQVGMDRDLAIVYLEHLWAESRIYKLEDD